MREEASRAAAQATTTADELSGPARATRSRTRASSHDARDQYLAEVKSLIANYDPNDRRADRPIRAFLFQSKSRLAGLPGDELKQICNDLEKDGLDDIELLFWGSVVEAAARSDPAWAISNIAQIISTKVTDEPQQRVLHELGKGGSFGSQCWSTAYAEALDDWLDKAEADRRLQGMETPIATLRFDTALATGDLPGAVARLGQLSADEQKIRAADLAQAAHESGQSRRMIEDISATAEPVVLETFSRELTTRSGFENTRTQLAAAELTPEKHDLAAAGIASANIGPETPARARWLLESLKADTPAAVIWFSENWTQVDHKSAGQWLAGLPQGAARDAAIAGFAPQAAKLDGATAVEWALGVSDPALRETTLRSVVRTWTQREPQAAAGYLQQKGIGAEPPNQQKQ